MPWNSVFAGTAVLGDPNTPLVTRDDFAEWFGVDATSPTVAARVDTALEIASQDCRSETNQQLTVITETLTVTPSTDGYLVLPQWPVSAVSSVVVDGVTMTNGTDYSWNDRGIITPRTFCLVGHTQPRTVAVSYTHGWDPLPRDIAGVCLARAKRLYDSPNAQPVESETLGSWSVKYAPLMDGLTIAEKYTLARYASWTNGY